MKDLVLFIMFSLIISPVTAAGFLRNQADTRTRESTYESGILDENLRLAAEEGNVLRIERLLNRGADIEGRDDYGESALMYAAAADKVTVLEALIDRGAEVDGRNVHGAAALMLASSAGALGSIEILLNRGADINARNKVGMTALMTAAYHNQAEAVSLLLSRGADAAMRRGVKRKTALDIAVEEGNLEVIDLLRAR